MVRNNLHTGPGLDACFRPRMDLDPGRGGLPREFAPPVCGAGTPGAWVDVRAFEGIPFSLALVYHAVCRTAREQLIDVEHSAYFAILAEADAP
jgi:hypothetical protein